MEGFNCEQEETPLFKAADSLSFFEARLVEPMGVSHLDRRCVGELFDSCVGRSLAGIMERRGKIPFHSGKI